MRARSVALLALALGGCVEPPFSVHARDNDVEDLRRALLNQAKEPLQPKNGRPTAYLVTAGDRHLVAFDLGEGRVTWEMVADVTSRLAIGRGFIAHRMGKQSIVVRSSANGQVRCSATLRPEEQFIGLAADDRLYVVVHSSSGTTRTSAVFAVSPHTCGELWRDGAVGSMGAPAARGGLVAVPYAYQNVVLLDGLRGAEVARVRATDESVSFVRAAPEGFFYGDNRGIYLLNEKSAAGSKKGSSYTEARLVSAQIRTFYYWDAYHPSQADYTAFDRNRLLWRAEPQGEGGISFHDGRACLHSYRYFFCFAAGGGDIRWAYAHPRVDLVASDDTGPAMVFASTDGEVGALDAKTGAPVWSKQTGLKLAGATFDADGFSGGTGEAAPIAKTLAGIVWDPDARFTAVKVFAIAAMTRVAGQDVTEELVKVVTRPGMAPPVVRAAAEALLTRRDAESKPIYRTALAVHADYLADQRAHGVDTLAKVVAAVEDREAAPLLAAHLLDPATPLPALREIARALIALGHAETPEATVAPLRDLLLSYRSDAAFLVDPQSLELAAEGLLRLGGPEGRRTVEFVAEEPRTLPPLAVYLRRALRPVAAAPTRNLEESHATASPR